MTVPDDDGLAKIYSALEGAFSWAHHLPPGARRQLAAEIAAWKGTAEIYADPGLLKRAIKPLDETGASSAMDDEPDPTWEEAVAAFEAATPVRLVRPPRTVVIDLTCYGSVWVATSAQLGGFSASGFTASGVEKIARDNLEAWLDPAVTLEFR